MTERARGLGKKNPEEIGKGNQMTALRFQTGGGHQTSPASLWGLFKVNRYRHNSWEQIVLKRTFCTKESSTSSWVGPLNIWSLKLLMTWSIFSRKPSIVVCPLEAAVRLALWMRSAEGRNNFAQAMASLWNLELNVLCPTNAIKRSK